MPLDSRPLYYRSARLSNSRIDCYKLFLPSPLRPSASFHKLVRFFESSLAKTTHTRLYPVKNFQTKCQGLSLSLYLFMIFGDSTHVLSTISQSLQKDDMLENVGWLAGFGISNLLSIMVMPSFLFYFCFSADGVRSLGRSCIISTLTGEGLCMLPYFCFDTLMTSLIRSNVVMLCSSIHTDNALRFVFTRAEINNLNRA